MAEAGRDDLDKHYGGDGVDLSGGELDEGYQMRVAAAFTDDTGQIASATSAATVSVIDITPTLSVTVSGVAQEGQTLVATAIANDSDASVGYQWQQLIGATWTNIAGAMGSTYAITEANEGNRLRVVATSSDSDGSGTSATSIATASVADPPPTLTIPIPSLFVAAGGSVSLPLSVSGFDSDDKVSVMVAGLPAFETITDNLDKKSFSGSSVTLSAAEVNSGLTLHSSYGGTGQPVNVLTVTAANTTPGEGATSAAQTITVTDPPVPTTLASAQDHTDAARLAGWAFRDGHDRPKGRAVEPIYDVSLRYLWLWRCSNPRGGPDGHHSAANLPSPTAARRSRVRASRILAAQDID